jgi:hypothetical protein
MSLAAFTKPRFMLCEGDDDKGFFEALITTRGLPEFQICHSAEVCGTGGITGFAKSLGGMEVLSGWRDLKALLIVADNDLVGPSFGAAQKALTDNGHVAPAHPAAVGRMFGKPVAILMIPSANTVGDLESMCLPAVYGKWPKAKRCVTFFLKCAGALKCSGANNWNKRASVSKARVRSATVGFNEDDPYKGIGHLFRNGTLSVNDPCFDEVAAFLRGFDAMCGI